MATVISIPINAAGPKREGSVRPKANSKADRLADPTLSHLCIYTQYEAKPGAWTSLVGLFRVFANPLWKIAVDLDRLKHPKHAWFPSAPI